MEHVDQNMIWGVIEHSIAPEKPDINYITTQSDFWNKHDAADFFAEANPPGTLTDRLILKDEQLPKQWLCSPTSELPAKRYSILQFPLADPVSAAIELDKFVNGTWNSSDYAVATERCSPEAVRLLAGLLTPFQQAIRRDPYFFASDLFQPTRDSAPTYSVANIFTQLDLMRAERHRYSVTQGRISVLVNHQPVVDFGDEIWLKRKDGSMTNGFQDRAAAPMYGPIIDGYGSIVPDNEVCRSAIVQFPDQIIYQLENYGKSRLTDLLKDAASRSADQTPGLPNNRSANLPRGERDGRA